jgi:1-deoxy-D-xylulose-5-phosphate synthase
MGLVLDRINGPHDLRDLSPAELKRLAEEARQKIIEVITVTGGHPSARRCWRAPAWP